MDDPVLAEDFYNPLKEEYKEDIKIIYINEEYDLKKTYRYYKLYSLNKVNFEWIRKGRSNGRK